MKGDRIETGVEEEETNFRIFIFRPLYTSGVLSHNFRQND